MCICSAQKIVGDRLRPEAAKDPHGVAEARERLRSCYDMINRQMAGGPGRWEKHSASPIAPRCRRCSTAIRSSRSARSTNNVAAYLERLKARPSVARVLAEAEPYFKLFPQ